MTLRGSVAAFPLETIVQLLAATGKTGQLEVRGNGDAGTLGFDHGRLVSAVIGEDLGDPALGAVFTMTEGDFEFVAWDDPPRTNLAGDLSALLDLAVVQRDRIVADRLLIPNDELRFALSGRAADQGEVRLSAAQWEVLLAVNGQRDLREIASHAGMGRLAMLSLLADLVRSGVVDVREGPPEPPSPEPRPPETRPPEPEPAPPPPAPEPTRRPDYVRPGSYEPEAPASSPETASVPPDEAPQDDVDERLAAISGVFAAQHGAAWAPPVAEEPRTEEEAGPLEDVADLAAPDEVVSPAPEPTPPPPVAAEPPKRGLFAGLFKKESHPSETATATAPSGRVLALGALANALLDEYAKSDYGRGRIDDRIANLLMRVDEQADPIDHAIPVTRDRVDVDALARASVSDRQVAPYLALLVSQIYEDAERAFGKDKAKRGYRAAVSSVAGADALGSDLRLPKA